MDGNASDRQKGPGQLAGPLSVMLEITSYTTEMAKDRVGELETASAVRRAIACRAVEAGQCRAEIGAAAAAVASREDIEQ